MRRREVVVGLSAVTACPRPGYAQPVAMPVIGFLRNASPLDSTHLVAAFHNGLAETGYVEGRTVSIEYRWTGGQTDRLPSMAADLVDRSVSVIVALGSTPAVRAAKAATTATPIVFMLGADPVELGLVASLARPGGNLTGVFNLNQRLAQKWLELLRELVPGTETFALLVNPTNPATTERYTSEMQAAGRALGTDIIVFDAVTERDFERAFLSVRHGRAGALVIAADLLFISHIEQLAALALAQKVPAIYPFREFVFAGGLVSYGTNLAETYRLAGVYTGRILRGERPADLPVQQASSVELLLNLRTAKALGLTIPPTLLARADEVIE